MLRRGAVISLFLFLLGLQAGAQGVCVPEPLKVRAVCGQVVTPLSKGEEGLIGAKLRLREAYYQGPTVAETSTDASGYFSFEGIKPGKYVLDASCPGLIHLSVDVRLGRQTRHPHSYIVIGLSVDARVPCGGGYAEVRKRPAGSGAQPPCSSK